MPSYIDEDYAQERLREMVAEYSDELHTLWHWGDGFGGFILEEIRHGIDAKSEREVLNPSYKKKVMSHALKKQVFERDKYRCLHCGTHLDLCADHINPESKGGETTLENLQTLCRSCNSKKGVS